MDIKIYTAIYEPGPDGVIAPDGLNLLILSKYIGMGMSSHSLKNPVTTMDDLVTIVVNDPKGSFWPVIVKLSNEEAEKLAAAITETVRYRKQGEVGQTQILVD